MYTSESVKDFYNRGINKRRYGEAIDKSGLWDSEKNIFEKYAKKSDKILDLGCGAGRTTINLYRSGHQNIIGLDISDKLVEYAKNYSRENGLNIEFIVGDATEIDCAPGTFDVVFFSYNGLMCIPRQENREKVINNAYKILKEKGIFIFTAHNRDDSGKFNQFWADEKVKWDNGVQDSDLFEYGDKIDVNGTGEKTFIHFSNIKEIEQSVTKFGFKVLEYKKRSEIAQESEAVKEFSGETVFWVLQK